MLRILPQNFRVLSSSRVFSKDLSHFSTCQRSHVPKAYPFRTCTRYFHQEKPFQTQSGLSIWLNQKYKTHQPNSMEWTKGLFIGSSLCLVSTFSREDCENASFFSKSAGNKNDNSDEDDPLEKLKKKLQSLLDEGVSSYSSSFIPKDLQELQDQINDFLASGKGGQISWGFIMGVSSGFALKKVSKLGALALGVLFILLQYASYTGYIDVNYKKLERDVIEFFDLNKDGKFDTEDIDAMYQSIMKVLEFSLPAGSGFSLGFMVGFRAG